MLNTVVKQCSGARRRLARATSGLALATMLLTGSPLFEGSPAKAQTLEVVRTETQPTFTGFPTFVADKMGFFKAHGIDARIRYVQSGAPTLQSAAVDGWDVAFLGAPPAVIGASSLGLIIVGMIMDEGRYHELIGRPDYVASVEADHKRLDGAKIFVTTLSTGHYMVEGCLRRLGLKLSDVSIIPSDQPATVSAFEAGQGDLAQVWPPQSTVLRGKGDKVLCDGAAAQLVIPSVWVATPKFLKAHPELVTRWLAANLDAIAWMKKDFGRTLALYKQFDTFRGYNLPEAALNDETRIAMSEFLSDQQIAEMTGPNPPLAVALDGIGAFFVRAGRLQRVPDFTKLIDVAPLQLAATQVSKAP